jgi:hypothetical protein
MIFMDKGGASRVFVSASAQTGIKAIIKTKFFLNFVSPT